MWRSGWRDLDETKPELLTGSAPKLLCEGCRVEAYYDPQPILLDPEAIPLIALFASSRDAVSTRDTHTAMCSSSDCKGQKRWSVNARMGRERYLSLAQ